MNVLRAVLCKLGQHHWQLWSADGTMSMHLSYVCTRCNARRRV